MCFKEVVKLGGRENASRAIAAIVGFLRFETALRFLRKVAVPLRIHTMDPLVLG